MLGQQFAPFSHAVQQQLPMKMDGEFLDVSELTEADFAACREAMRLMDTKPERIENWMSRIRKGKWHALTSLLLLHLPNLEDIEMIDYRHDEAGDMEYALGIAARLQASGVSTQFSLEHLTDVSISAFTPPEDDEPNTFGHSPTPENLYFCDIVPFLRLPSVQSVAISRLSIGDARDRGFFPPKESDGKFGTKELEITDSCIEMWSLVLFLRLFTSLRRLSYNHVAEEQESDFLPQEIGKAIVHLHPCLEELEISGMCQQNGKYTTPDRIGSLAGFEKLRRIEVEGPTLFGSLDVEDESMPVFRLCDILPRALETLVLSPSDSLCHEEHLRELLKVKEEKFPELKRIEMKWLGRSLGDPEGLKMDFKAKGVKILL